MIRSGAAQCGNDGATGCSESSPGSAVRRVEARHRAIDAGQLTPGQLTRGPGNSPAEPARVLLALDVDGVLLDPQRGGRGPWQVAFSERFGVDAGRLDGTLFAGA